MYDVKEIFSRLKNIRAFKALIDLFGCARWHLSLTNDIVVNTLRAVRKTVIDFNKRAMYLSIIDAYCEYIGISTDECLYEIRLLSPQISHEKNGARFSSGMALKIEQRNLSSCGFVSYVGEIRVDHEGNKIQTSIGLTKRSEGNQVVFCLMSPSLVQSL